MKKKNLQGVRLHDEMYLRTDRSKNVKHIFIKIIEEIVNYKKIEVNSICDIGCASGDLLFAVCEKFNNTVIHGIDVRQDLIKAAKKKVHNASFFTGNINSLNFIKKNQRKYDVVVMSGVLQIFDDIKVPLDNCIKLLNKNGLLIIIGPFNPYPVDVIMRYADYSKSKKIDNRKHIPMQTGFNIFSCKHMKLFIKKNYPKFKISFDEIIFPKSMKYKINKTDLDRSWNIEINNKNIWVNGNQIIQHQYLCKIISN